MLGRAVADDGQHRDRPGSPDEEGDGQQPQIGQQDDHQPAWRQQRPAAADAAVSAGHLAVGALARRAAAVVGRDLEPRRTSAVMFEARRLLPERGLGLLVDRDERLDVRVLAWISPYIAACASSRHAPAAASACFVSSGCPAASQRLGLRALSPLSGLRAKVSALVWVPVVGAHWPMYRSCWRARYFVRSGGRRPGDLSSMPPGVGGLLEGLGDVPPAAGAHVDRHLEAVLGPAFQQRLALATSRLVGLSSGAQQADRQEVLVHHADVLDQRVADGRVIQQVSSPRAPRVGEVGFFMFMLM